VILFGDFSTFFYLQKKSSVPPLNVLAIAPLPKLVW
jgi:hypothetical protein